MVRFLCVKKLKQMLGSKSTPLSKQCRSCFRVLSHTPAAAVSGRTRENLLFVESP